MLRFLVLGCVFAGAVYSSRLPGQDVVYHIADHDFGIGIDLTPSYATASIAYQNGSHIPLALVPGDGIYRDVMFRLSLSPEQRYRDPTLNISEKETISVLSSILTLLARAATTRLGGPISAAAITVPHLPVLADTALQGALFLAGIEYVQVLSARYFGRSVAFHENALLAGHALQLCQPYTSPPGPCEEDLTYEAYYVVGYYADALEVVLAGAVLAYDISPKPYTNADLGYRALREGSDADWYWAGVRDWLALPLVDFDGFKPTKVVFCGVGSGDALFQKIVREVLEPFHDPHGPLQIVDDGVDATFAASFGAAELMMRRPYWHGGQRQGLGETLQWSLGTGL